MPSYSIFTEFTGFKEDCEDDKILSSIEITLEKMCLSPLKEENSIMFNYEGNLESLRPIFDKFQKGNSKVYLARNY